jgi:hypothetical protein
MIKGMIPQHHRLTISALFFAIPFLLLAQNKQFPCRIKLPATLKEVSGMTLTSMGDLWLLNDSHNRDQPGWKDHGVDRLSDQQKIWNFSLYQSQRNVLY